MRIFGDQEIPFFSDILYIVMSNHFTHYLKYRQKEDKLLTKVRLLTQNSIIFL